LIFLGILIWRQQKAGQTKINDFASPYRITKTGEEKNALIPYHDNISK